MSNGEQKGIQVQIPDNKSDILYSDQAFITTSPMGLTIDFGQQTPQLNLVRIVSRIALSPTHAKLFSDLLKNQVANFEKQFGEIKVPAQTKEQIEKAQKIGFVK